MQTSILSVLLALGLPGANSCSAQQPLPRVGQNPPVATQGEEGKPADADEEDADEPEVMEVEGMEADEADGADEPLAEIAEIRAEKSACAEAQEKIACKAKCEGSGCGTTQSDPLLGNLLGSADTLALGGHQVVRINEKDLEGGMQKLTIQPGSTVILETKNGKQVTLRALDGNGLQSTNGNGLAGMMALRGLGYTTQSEPQGQDERVRELEKRVRELEAQLRERDGQNAFTPQPFWSNQAQAESREKATQERTQMRELHQRMSAQARDQAAQARKQAEEIRRQAERFQKQAAEQQKLWRADAQDAEAQELYKWKAAKAPRAPKPPKAPRAAVAAPVAPEVYAESEPGVAAPEGPGVYSRSAGPSAPHVRGLRTPQPAHAGPMGGEHVQELQSMLNEMRKQMDEMREQMQALRQELERAPQREMR